MQGRERGHSNEPAGATGARSSASGWRLVRAVWRTYARTAQRYQSALILSAVYVLVVGPTSILGRIASARFLPTSGDRHNTTWWRRAEPPPDLERLRRPY